MKEELNQNYWLNKGIIWLTGEINDELAERVVRELFYLKTQNFSVITIMLNSPGGSVSAGFYIHDTMKLIEKYGIKIKTVCCGICASMAAFLLAAGSIRESLLNGETMIHQPLGGMQGQASDMGIAWKHMQRIKLRYEKLLSEYTGKTLEEIQMATDRDNYMDADEALSFGLVDRIVDHIENITED